MHGEEHMRIDPHLPRSRQPLPRSMSPGSGLAGTVLLGVLELTDSKATDPSIHHHHHHYHMSRFDELPTKVELP